MPSRNIAVQKGIYEALVKEKRPGESFTSVIRRLLSQSGGLEELSGAWGGPERGMHASLRTLREGKGRAR